MSQRLFAETSTLMLNMTRVMIILVKMVKGMMAIKKGIEYSNIIPETWLSETHQSLGATDFYLGIAKLINFTVYC